jgi:hypothetical protein
MFRIYSIRHRRTSTALWARPASFRKDGYPYDGSLRPAGSRSLFMASTNAAQKLEGNVVQTGMIGEYTTRKNKGAEYKGS